MTTKTTAPAADFVDVVAEDAPLGVQLWPTTSPEFAPNFILAEVTTLRGAYGTRVVWTSENGNTRTFALGEIVVCKF